MALVPVRRPLAVVRPAVPVVVAVLAVVPAVAVAVRVAVLVAQAAKAREVRRRLCGGRAALSRRRAPLIGASAGLHSNPVNLRRNTP